MKISEISPNLYLLKFSNQYKISSTFMRLQEFYESPYETIRDKHFTWDQFFDVYVKNGRMNYWSQWAGFNVPGHVIRKFFKLFAKELTEKEQELYKLIVPIIKSKKDFYLISVYQKTDIRHEEAHGLFYLNIDYKNEVTNLIKAFSLKYFNILCNNLAKKGYSKNVFIDEIQAYAIDGNKRKFLRLFKKYRHKT